LAEFLFGSESTMVRIDMSEYKDDKALDRLTGPPPGLVGYERGGTLTEALKHRCVGGRRDRRLPVGEVDIAPEVGRSFFPNGA
jgi:hypothetical protein